MVSSLGGGGAERVVVDLCRHLRDSGRDVTLMTLSGNDADAYAVSEGVRRERMEIRRSAFSQLDTIRFSLSHLVAMRRRFISLRPDVVVSFVDQTNVRSILALLGTGIPVIVSERVHPAHNPISEGWKIARHLVYPFADAVTVQTREGAKWFRRCTRVRRLAIIANAARSPEDLRAAVTASEAVVPRPLILGIGRLTRQKGFDLLLDAFHRSGLMHHGWHLAILGEGVERGALLQQVSSLGIADAVTLPGYLSDVGLWLRQADLFVLSSRYEGFPNVLMEAMQLGKASVSFDCPSGPSELVEGGVNGCLVQPGDVVSLAETMKRVALDPDLRGRLGTAAAKVSERFSPAAIYGRWIRLIDLAAAGELRNQETEYLPELAGNAAEGTQPNRGGTVP